jgi:5'-3' exonuclease
MTPVTDRLMLLDSASLYFRAFYGVPDTVRAPNGTPVNAVRGFLDIITRLVTTYEPTHLVACWDDDWRPQWRVDLIPTYKTHRVAVVTATGPDIEVVPDPLEVQVPIIRQTLDALGIPIVGAAEHEADDVIGTLATRATLPVDVVTGDRDLFQLVDDESDVRIIYTARGMSNLEIVTNATVVEVVKNLDLPETDSRLRPLDQTQRADAASLAEQWALGTAMTRIIDALDAAGSR